MATLKDRLERLKGLGLVRGSCLTPPDTLRPHGFDQDSESGQALESGPGNMSRVDHFKNNSEVDDNIQESVNNEKQHDRESSIPLNGSARNFQHKDRTTDGNHVAALGQDWIQSSEYVWTREIRISHSFPENLDIENFRVSFMQKPIGEKGFKRTGTSSNVKITLIKYHEYEKPNPASTDEDRSSETIFAQDSSAIIPWRGLRFFDFETTGLSGGSGTVAFLSATGWSDGDDFIVRQRFLADFPGEPDFIRLVLEDITGYNAVLTYNGASFDLPLLRTRCIMNAVPFLDIEHVDVLTSARRLWKATLGSVSLQNLEIGLLGHFRENDVPGSEIPARWFAWLNSGDASPLKAVFRHNVQDIVTLAKITSRAANIFEKPLSLVRNSPVYGGVDALRLARVCFARNRIHEAEELLLSLASDGNEKAGLILSSHYRRTGKIEERGAVLELLPGTSKVLSERSRFEEHSMKNPQQAYMLAIKALQLAPEPKLEKWLINRCIRLEKTISRIENIESDFKGIP